jgi:hypothetical protein
MLAKSMLLIAAAITLSVGAASPATAAATYSPPVAKVDNPSVELVQNRSENRRKWRYQRRHHGERYHSRRSNYRYYRDGWWYSRPFWNMPGFGFGITIGPGGRSSAHVEWCEDRYRSYNRRTDMFLGYDGDYHRCNSPYR